MIKFIIMCLILASAFVTVAQDNVVDVSVTNPTPYLGEIFTYSIKFTSSLDLGDAQIQPPQFVGFAQQPQQISRSTETTNGVILNIIQQDIILYANRDGNLVIEPSTIVVPDTPFQSGVQRDSTTLSINVQSLPPNPPPTFTDAVGQFDVSVTIDPLIVQAGEPNTLKIDITGTGNFNQFSSPPLQLPPDWDIFERPPRITNSSTTIQTKTFEFQFFANQTGALEIPPVNFTFFNPVTEGYQTIEGQTGGVTVEGQFRESSNSNVQITNRLALKPMTDRPEALEPSSGFWILWLIPPAITLIFTIIRLVTGSSQSKTNEAPRSQSKSFKAVATQLTQARQIEPNQAFAIVEQSIIQYLSAKYQQEVNADDIPHLITKLPVTLQQRVIVCMEQAQSGRYAPVTTEDAEMLIRRTYKTLQLIEGERS